MPSRSAQARLLQRQSRFYPSEVPDGDGAQVLPLARVGSPNMTRNPVDFLVAKLTIVKS
jgi:hypothetical protein